VILTFTIVNYSFEVYGLFVKKNQFKWLLPYDNPSVIEHVCNRDTYSNSLYLICLYTKQTTQLKSVYHPTNAPTLLYGITYKRPPSCLC